MASVTPLQRERKTILAALLVLSAATWAVLVWQSRRQAMDMDMGASLTFGMSAPLFMAMWVFMMVAMMFPTAAPMVLTFATVSRNRQARGQTYVPTWFFVAAYLAVWTLFGVVAFAAAAGIDQLGVRVMVLHENAARIGGAVLVLGGVYQLTPLKNICLTKCRSPLSFILTSWREGWRGALRMGVGHGTYCLGCCWLLFVLLFPLGVMNVAAMGLVTLLIFAEKSLPWGLWIGRATGVGLVAFGAVVLTVPALLPTTL